MFIYPSVDGRLICFYCLAIMNNAAIDVSCRHVFISLRYPPRGGIVGANDNSMLYI